MKIKTIFLFVLLSVLDALCDINSGVFCIDKNTTCHIVSQNGQIQTNVLEFNKTYSSQNNLFEFNIEDTTIFYFSDKILIQCEKNTSFNILLFDQEFENIKSLPTKAKFGSHNLNLAFNKGEMVFIYPNTNSNSRININTPFADYELMGGKYYFNLNSTLCIGYVYDGEMVIHGNKEQKTVKKDQVSLVMPLTITNTGLQDKTIVNVQSIGNNESQKFSESIIILEKKKMLFDFFVIDGKIIGVLIE